MTVDLRRGTSRFETAAPGRRTRHSFSFGQHYDPANVGLGPLTCHDDHLLGPGAGFPDHRHVDVEIVTWVVAGTLVHDGTAPLVPGRVAVQSAASGITHSEVAGEAGCRFVQAWLRPDEPGGTPARAVAEVDVVPGALTPLVGAGAPLTVGVAGASLDVVRLPAGSTCDVPAAPRTHAYVVTGSVTTGPELLREGDAFRLTDGPALVLAARDDADVLVWRFR